MSTRSARIPVAPAAVNQSVRPIRAERVIAAPTRSIHRFLADAASHRRLVGHRLRQVELEEPAAGLIRGVMVMRGPLGISRRAAIRTEAVVDQRLITGTARVGRATLATVTWVLEPASATETLVGLQARVLTASRLDSLLLRLGGAAWLRRLFGETLARLAAEVEPALTATPGGKTARPSLYVLRMPPPSRITTEQELRAIIGHPKPIVSAKLATELNELTRQFVERSPFVCVATARPEGGLDVSPRGDPPGFVRVLDERTLLLPERPGNRLADTLLNLLEDPRIALLFLIPGVGDTFRVNGTAYITDDAELLAPSALEDRVPGLGIVVSVQEAYTQCAKALLRSDLWNPDRHIKRTDLPSSGEILKRISLPDLDVAEHERQRAARYARREGFY